MNLELNENQVYLLKELIYSEIDRVGGFEELDEELQSICWRLSE